MEVKEKLKTTTGKIDVNKRKNKINDLIHTIQPLLLFEYLLGIFRFRITINGPTPTSRSLRIFGIIVMSTHVFLYVFFFKLPNTGNDTKSLVSIINTIPSIAVIIQFFTSAIVTSFLSTSNISIFSRIANIDATLYINRDVYTKARNRTFKHFTLFTLFHISVALCDILTDDEIVLSKCLVLPIYFEENLETVVFCLILSIIRSRLTVINAYLTKFINNKDNKKCVVYLLNKKEQEPESNYDFIGRTSDNNMKIRDLASVYDSIGETCALINHVFNYQLLTTLVSTFIYIVITIWSSLYFFRNENSTIGPFLTIILWAITIILNVTIMCFNCEKLLLARNNTRVLVNKIIMDYDLPKTMRMQAKAFMDLIEAWPLRIFVYNMFSVDITLMLKYISVATTYLIVIIQVSHFT